MTFERSLSTWEPMELRHLGDVAGVIQGGQAVGRRTASPSRAPATPASPT